MAEKINFKELYDYSNKSYDILKERAIEEFIHDLTCEWGALATSWQVHTAKINLYDSLFGKEELENIRAEVKKRIEERGLKMRERTEKY